MTTHPELAEGWGAAATAAVLIGCAIGLFCLGWYSRGADNADRRREHQADLEPDADVPSNPAPDVERARPVPVAHPPTAPFQRPELPPPGPDPQPVDRPTEGKRRGRHSHPR